ncbi:hypothetical protein LTR37_007539 [Vermiconidia calcicola]|uniref:Uncharacterized protein n=1 Tax=Vermiconidia calcicola TaxID=1690605 RepID=A0ACC3NDM2_9PEZI|nr:hypothetical protein LTR37_007539 [Vermiconidia calcicola]
MAETTEMGRVTTPATVHSTSDERDVEFEDSRINVAAREDVPPDGGYGWICTGCVFVINAHTWGVNSAWGIFLAYFLAHSSFPDATQLEYALIGGMSISMSLLISPAVGVSNSKLGTRITLFIGTGLVSLSMLMASFASQVWHLFLSQGVCFGFGMGFLYITASPMLGQWFAKKRSLAVGIASSGAGFGGLAYNLGAGAAVEAVGVPWTYRILAATTLAMNLISSILLKDRNKMVKPQHKRFNIREFAHISTVLVILWGTFTELGYIVLLYSLPNYAQSIGLSASQGSVVGAVLNLGLAFGRPVVGFVSDAWGRIDIATAMTALCGIFCLALWVPAHSYAVLLVFALCSGTVAGTFWGTVVPVTAEVTGLQRLPSAFGMICLPLVVPTIFAEPIALELVAFSGYLSAKVFVGCMFLAGAASTWALRSWKICELEKKELRERDDNVADASSTLKQSKFWLTPRRLFMNRRV